MKKNFVRIVALVLAALIALGTFVGIFSIIL